jgi:hypothetical protein
MTKDVLKYLQPNAVIPIDMETTTALVNALKERLAQETALQALHNENERLGLYKDAYAEQEPLIGCVNHDCDKCKLLKDERLELIGHADLAINNIYIFNGFVEYVPEDRTPIYAGYKAAHGIKETT